MCLSVTSLVTVSLVSGCRKAQVHSVPMAAVMQTIRSYNSGFQLVSTARTEPRQDSGQAPDIYDLQEPYQAHIRSLFAQEDFAALDAEVRQVRQNQSRARGGTWKLYLFYEAVASPPSGAQPPDSDWRDRLAVIARWTAAHPDSAAARIALADAYVNYAWAARGNGYADSVSGSAGERFN